MDVLAIVVGGANDTEGGSVPGGCQGAGVANGHDVPIGLDKFGSVLADRQVHFEVFAFDILGISENGLKGAGRQAFNPIERPKKVHRGWAGLTKDLIGFQKVLIVESGERHTVGGRDSDCRCSSNHHVSDTISDVLRRVVRQPFNPGWKHSLVEHFEVVIDPSHRS